MLLATPHAVLFIGRLVDLAALTATAPPHALLFVPRPDPCPDPRPHDGRPDAAPSTARPERR